jgi:hypothetical protein
LAREGFPTGAQPAHAVRLAANQEAVK